MLAECCSWPGKPCGISAARALSTCQVDKFSMVANATDIKMVGSFFINLIYWYSKHFSSRASIQFILLHYPHSIIIGGLLIEIFFLLSQLFSHSSFFFFSLLVCYSFHFLSNIILYRLISHSLFRISLFLLFKKLCLISGNSFPFKPVSFRGINNNERRHTRGDLHFCFCQFSGNFFAILHYYAPSFYSVRKIFGFKNK